MDNDKELNDFLNSLTAEHTARRALIDDTVSMDALTVEETTEIDIRFHPELQAEALYHSAPWLAEPIDDDWMEGTCQESVETI